MKINIYITNGKSFIVNNFKNVIKVSYWLFSEKKRKKDFFYKFFVLS